MVPGVGSKYCCRGRVSGWVGHRPKWPAFTILGFHKSRTELFRPDKTCAVVQQHRSQAMDHSSAWEPVLMIRPPSGLIMCSPAVIDMFT
ncbi:hypothetical protein RHECIAT_CH0001209 [Rhizobium etli CIAT 652]|uniref:Uncharacterized protein n=1 Tax=Rhizobium etli (strain CIAT 652) TaxID=491916 RepID=B3PTD0_RHIE6|nr:hypothetical protein RHECIAT_CH0001209 [Rhizobium etli CIAT 652]